MTSRESVELSIAVTCLGLIFGVVIFIGVSCIELSDKLDKIIKLYEQYESCSSKISKERVK